MVGHGIVTTYYNKKGKFIPADLPFLKSIFA